MIYKQIFTTILLFLLIKIFYKRKPLKNQVLFVVGMIYELLCTVINRQAIQNT